MSDPRPNASDSDDAHEDEAAWARLSALLLAARHVPPGERDAFLERECAGDQALLAEARALLEGARLDDTPTEALHGAVADAAAHLARDGERVPRRIGPHRVVDRIAEGGMGIVFEAEQESPRRRIAVKILKPWFVTSQVRRRFDHEAQTLARLRHPGIAQVIDAGIGEVDGLPGEHPWFAMELVRGEPLTRHCALKHVALRERLELFARACDAVHHAHLCGVVHRDLKPGNILVDEHGDPKLLDFGIACLSDDDVEPVTRMTEMGQVLGTLSYMAPEQAAGDPSRVDARADVHALAAILHELLTGRPPLDVSRLSLPEALRAIREDQPPRLASLDARLGGDLETIVAKGLEKEPSRRYASAAELAADVRRYLADEPIQARPPSAWYQLSKLARRHRVAVFALVLALVALVTGTLVATREAFVATEARREAQARESEARHAAYRAGIAAAAAAIEDGDVGPARRQLLATPEELRGAEWTHLAGRLDDSEALLRPPHAQELRFLMQRGSVDWPRMRRPTDGGRSLELVAAASDPLAGTVVRLDASPVVVPAEEWPGIVAGATLLLPGEMERVVLARDETLIARVARPPGTPPHLAWVPIEGASRLLLGARLRDDCLLVADAATGQTWNAEPAGHGPYASPDGARIAWGLGTGSGLYVLPLEAGATPTLLVGHSAEVRHVAFSPDSRVLASLSWDATVRTWDAVKGKAIATMNLGSAGGTCAVFSPDGSQIAIGRDDGSILVTRSSLERAELALIGHEAPLVSITWPMPGTIYSIGSDGTVRRWATGVGHQGLQVLRGHDSYVYELAASPDGARLWSGGWDGSVVAWNARDGSFAARRRICTDSDAFIDALAISPDGERLAVSCLGHPLQLLDARTLESVAVAGLESRPTARLVGCDRVDDAYQVTSFAWSPDGSRLATGERSGHVRTWDAATLASLREVPACDDEARRTRLVRVAWHPDGTSIATACESESVALRDPATLSVVARLPLPEGSTPSAITRIAWNPAGTLLAAARTDGGVLVHAKDGASRLLAGSGSTLHAVAFSADGTRLAAGGVDEGLHVWDATSWAELVILHGHESYIHAIAFAPDGSWLASASGDRTVRLWRVDEALARHGIGNR